MMAVSGARENDMAPRYKAHYFYESTNGVFIP